MSRAVQYRKFGGPGILQMAEVADPAPSGGEVRVAVEAVGLNPVDAKIFGGDIRLKILESIQRLTHPVCWFGSPRFPRGVARDFAGFQSNGVIAVLEGFNVFIEHFVPFRMPHAKTLIMHTKSENVHS